MDLHDEVAVLSGAGRGLGQAHEAALGAAGAAVKGLDVGVPGRDVSTVPHIDMHEPDRGATAEGTISGLRSGSGA